MGRQRQDLGERRRHQWSLLRAAHRHRERAYSFREAELSEKEHLREFLKFVEGEARKSQSENDYVAKLKGLSACPSGRNSPRNFFICLGFILNEAHPDGNACSQTSFAWWLPLSLIAGLATTQFAVGKKKKNPHAAWTSRNAPSML